MNTQELQAILTLLEDPDGQIYEALYQSFMEKGVDVVPDLEKVWEVSDNSEIQTKIEDIIHKIQLLMTNGWQSIKVSFCAILF